MYEFLVGKFFFEVEINIDIYRRIIKVDLYFFFFVFEGVRDFILKVSGIYMEIFIWIYFMIRNFFVKFVVEVVYYCLFKLYV